MRSPFRQIALLSMTSFVSLYSFAQRLSSQVEKNNDSVLQIAFRFVNDKNMESLLSLFSDDFKKESAGLEIICSRQYFPSNAFL
jgi:hypothetical protein